MEADRTKEQLLAAERARARQQAALFRLSAELAATLDEVEVCRRVVKGLHDTLGYDSVGLYLVDATAVEGSAAKGETAITSERYLAAGASLQPGALPTRIPAGQGLSERPLLDGLLHYTPDVGRDPRYVPGVGGSEVNVPIRIGEKVLGVLSVERQQLDAFDQDDFDVLTAAAQQAGLALEKARLLAAERQRADELDALRTTMADITAELELSGLLQAIVERATALLGATGGELGLYDETNQAIRILVCHNMGAGYVGTRVALGEGAMGYAAQSGKPLIVQDYQTWEGRSPQYADSRMHGGLSIPLTVGSRLVGAIAVVDTDPERQFGPADVHLLNLFAQQAAIAIDNARLFEAEQRRADQFQVIGEVGRRMTSLLAIDELLWEIARLIKETLGYYLVGLALIEGDELVFKAGAGAIWETPQFRPPRVKVGQEGITGWVAHSGEPLLVPDLSQEPRHYAIPEASEMRSELAVPLKTKERVIGVLHVQSDRLDAFDQSDLAVLQSLSHQAAIAIENARLYHKVQQEERYHRESERHLADIINFLPDATLVIDREGKVIAWNRAIEEMTGVKAAEMLGKSNYEYAIPFYGERRPILIDLVLLPDKEFERKYAQIQRQGPVLAGETYVPYLRGRARYLFATASVLHDSEGNAMGAIETIRDITERKEAERQIQLLGQIAQQMKDAVIMTDSDPESRIRYVNEAFTTLYGYTQDEVLGQPSWTLFAGDDAERERVFRETTEAIARRGEYRVEYQDRHKDGSPFWVSTTMGAVRLGEEGEPYDLAIVRDITDRKQAEQDLQQAKAAAEAANQAKSVFLANMSHELRTPLNAILGFTQLMDRDPNLTAEQQENLGIINRSGEHLLALINDVLEMSKIEAGRVTLQEKSFDLYRLLDTLEEMFRLRAEDKGLALSFERMGDVPQYVRADEGKLRQVLMNLLGNAVKFTEEGGVALRIARAMEEQRLILEVEDTGPGIAPEELQAVFEPFVQTASGQRSLEGTGLGLSISRQFARLMGGNITVRSELGRGSVFRLEVPIGLAEAAQVEVARPSRRVLGLEPGQAIYRLLIVDDKATTRQLLVKLLEPLGFEVHEAAHGQEAIEMWERWEPHLIWMDMRMPGMDGYEATRQIKATAKGQATVIVALTASAFEEDRETILSAGCDDVVRKPFRKDEIFDSLTKHLGVRFVYEAELALPTAAPLAEAQEALTPAALAALPPGWLAELQQATIKANLNLILTLVDQIRKQNAALADALVDLAHDFEYKKILTLIEQAGG
jgi:PAS domain S-box-containing protein